MGISQNKVDVKEFALPSIKDLMQNKNVSNELQESNQKVSMSYKIPSLSYMVNIPIANSLPERENNLNGMTTAASFMSNVPMNTGSNGFNADTLTISENKSISTNNFSNDYNKDFETVRNLTNVGSYNIINSGYGLPTPSRQSFDNQGTLTYALSESDTESLRRQPTLPNFLVFNNNMQAPVSQLQPTIETQSPQYLPPQNAVFFHPTSNEVLLNHPASPVSNHEFLINQPVYTLPPEQIPTPIPFSYYPPPMIPPLIKKQPLFVQQPQLISPTHQNNEIVYNNVAYNPNINSFSSEYKRHLKSKKKITAKSKGSKLFLCTICSKPFNRADTLKTHMNMHLGLKPFECEICRKKFNAKQNMLRHQRNHLKKKL